MEVFSIIDPANRVKLATALDFAELFGEPEEIERAAERYKKCCYRFDKDHKARGPLVRLIKHKPLSAKQLKHKRWIERTMLHGKPLEPRFWSVATMQEALAEASEAFEHRCEVVRSLCARKSAGEDITRRQIIDAVTDRMAAENVELLLQAKISDIKERGETNRRRAAPAEPFVPLFLEEDSHGALLSESLRSSNTLGSSASSGLSTARSAAS